MAATYTVKQVAQILGYSTNSIYTFLKEKRIKGVRVGTGRFRIPQSELDRLLHVKGESKQTLLAPSQPLIGQNTGGIVDTTGQTVSDIFSIGPLHVGLPNIFSWFIGLSAIIAGLSMYLYNQAFSGTSIALQAPIVNGMRVLFIGGGVGVLLVNIFGGSDTRWRKVFNSVLIFAGLLLTVYMWRQGDVDGLFIYGSLVIVLILRTLFSVGGLASFSLYLSLLAIGASVTPLLSPLDPHVVAFVGYFHVAPWIVSLGFGIAGMGFIVCLWWGYVKNRALYWLCTWIAAAAYFGLALSYANGQYWSRAFFMIIVGVMSMFAAPWESITTTKNRKEQLTALATYAVIIGALVVGIVVVGLMQLNVMQTLTQENTNKVAYARTSVENSLTSVQSTLLSVATNPNFVSAVGDRDTAELNDVSRVIFDSNNNIKRVIVLDKNGNGVNLYPVGTFNEPNYAFRDYFIEPEKTSAPFISNLFVAKADNTNINSVVVSVPLYTSDHSFAGVLVASLDLVAISARLQQIPVPNRGEYISVVDSRGVTIISPVTSQIGSPIAKNDPQLLGINGQHGIATGTTYDGKQAVVVYDTVDGVHWAIAMKTPIDAVYKLTNTTTLIVLAVVLCAIILATFFLQGVHLHWARKRKKEDSS